MPVNTIIYQVGLTRDSNPGPVFSIPGFGIGEFLIPGSRDPGGITGSRGMISKTVIIEHNGPILLILRLLSQSHRLG